MKLKSSLFLACQEYVNQRISRLNQSISELENDLENETKSSAGDKYETSREMINTEINKLSTQLQEFKKLKEVVYIARQKPSSHCIQLGSYVETSKANYLLAIPAGELSSESKKVYAIGINSPIALLIIGKQVGEDFMFNGETIKITTIL